MNPIGEISDCIFDNDHNTHMIIRDLRNVSWHHNEFILCSIRAGKIATQLNELIKATKMIIYR